MFERLGKEVPYCCEVRIETFREPRNNDDDIENMDDFMIQNNQGVIHIRASIMVERVSQKIIWIGKNGNMIK